MVQGFRANNRILIKVERATADNTKTEISKHVTAVTDQEPSILMNSDVLEIAARQKEKGQKALDKDARKILKHGGKILNYHSSHLDYCITILIFF